MYLDTRNANVAELKRHRLEERQEISGAAIADIGTAEARYQIGQALIRRRDFSAVCASPRPRPSSTSSRPWHWSPLMSTRLS
jgi:hypothetical protein